uniref:Translation elongation factor EF1B beta/delta subunit guanine nucleotide exchange domain-containing protein n=1 Tax=Octactis speculum TaxID=3111310 RepID=A0A7S2B9F2_9STRA|mmetsp:Transcript_21040/g.28610  ORF Transcript_21040/g.28610 Transcript_21040/m.28610 type:complete len:230 (+) Transcript_21040:42-731(+)|eukprot:CAMPEP_0185765508 /NCGR_PEP_ID=MMETSP1174-20130828/30373_1 /TAXON_ID=35687 /ORGANISM="Dictyocha speculum, Strain CCMP1381" /LENGTH=229 /DNA_ID=CAMNT_0028448685 /DNA_START=42 /DNA_END=731 /DNA_ORIENTATION=-
MASIADLASLNSFVADKSYIAGYAYSAEDVKVFESFGLPDKSAYPHAYRWYIHIAAQTGLPAALATTPAAAASAKPVKKAAEPPAKKAAAADDDDMDFGFDDDEAEEETKKPAEKSMKEKLEEKKQAALDRLAKKEAKQRSLCTLEIKPWDADQDLLKLFAKLKTEIVMDGLKWSENCALKDVAFGIKKIILTAVINMNLSMDAIIEDIIEGPMNEEIQSMEMTSMSLL